MPFKFQFTIRHLIIVIAVFAACLAMLRSPVGFLVLLVWGALPGYVIGRIRGGSGIFGGALSESACTALLFLASILHDVPLASSPVQAIVSLFPMACLAAVPGFILGLLISSGLYVIVQMTKHLFEPEPFEKAQGEIRYLPDGREEI
jgi:hypothetical protein